MKSKIERFTEKNGIKKKWLAEKLGISAELLSYHLAKGELPPELEAKGMAHLRILAKKLLKFASP